MKSFKSRKHMKFFLFIAVVSLLAVLMLAQTLLAAPSAPDAPSGGSGLGNIDPYSGSFSTRFPIEVPSFHGLEPKLSLAYDSSGGNGWAGVGWTLTGLSIIERVSPGRGAPKYDVSDIFLLDGVELTACSPSPCTTFGGNYRPRTENYERIKYDSTGNTWYVWSTTGVTSTYTPLMYMGGGRYFRWALSTVQDTNGNTANYNYWCDTYQNNCYVNTITYNGVTIQFYRENRPDPFTFANGVNVGATNYRLKSIDITVNGNRLRAYKLTYTSSPSPSTGRSLLQNVQEFGRDATVDTNNGTVTGGTSLPSMGFGYQTYTNTFTMSQWGYQLGTWGTGKTWVTGDFNGDGKTDIAAYYGEAYAGCGSPGAWAADVYASTGAGFTQQVHWATQQGCYWTAPFGNVGAQIWVTGDFNGDSKTDFAAYWNDNGTWTTDVHLSTGSSFTMQHWATQLGTWHSGATWVTGDFNGDGKTDFAQYWNDNGNWSADVYLSTGSSFVQQHWAVLQGGYWTSATDGQIWVTGDFNGDGKTDFAKFWKDNSKWTADVHLSTGTGFTIYRWATQVGSWKSSAKWVTGDFNGDGKTDIAAYYGDGTICSGNPAWSVDVFLSNGGGFSTPTQWAIQQGCYWTSQAGTLGPQQWLTGDFNGDGKTDFVAYWNDNGTWTTDMHRSTGTSFTMERWATQQGGYWTSATDGQIWLTGDFNGDGKLDFTKFWKDNNAWTDNTHLSTGPAPDLLTSISNGLGATTTVAYTPSTSWSNVFLPSAMQTVKAVTTTVATNGQNVSGTYTYFYSGGNWSQSERRFLGFRYVKTMLDTQGDYQETYNHQSINSIGKADKTYLRTSTGITLSYSVYTYTENSSVPYTSLLTQSSDYQCNGTANCRRVLTGLAYDPYGNVIETDEYGDASISGDERATTRGFYPNTTAYIVSLPAYENTFAGIGTGASLVAQTLYVYDANNSYAVSPTIGNLSQVQKWNNQTGGYVNVSMQYDAYGNVITTTDARGYTSTVQYDPTYHLYPIRSCNALSQCAQSAYYGVNGVPADNGLVGQLKQITDTNSTVVSDIYDAFGRKIAETNPGGLTSWQYGDSLSGEYIYQILPDGSADGLGSVTYKDGLGRTYLVIKNGPSQYINYYQQTIYTDASNLPYQQSLWYQEGDTVRYETFVYDPAGRVIKTIHPDGNYTHVTYTNDAGGKPYVASFDELVTHEKDTWSDVYGRLTKVVEHNQGASYTTTYQYDVLGNLLHSTDQAGNVSTMTYDSLGRKLSMSDPDMGYWTYVYDNGGLLLSQTDAKGQTISFGYDALGRMKSKTSSNATLFSDTFDTKDTTNWAWSSNQVVPFSDGGNNVVQSNGTGVDWNANFYRNAYSLTDGTGLQTRFKLTSATSSAIFSIENNDATYRRFGLYSYNGIFYAEYGTDGVNWFYPVLLNNVQLNTWYTLRILVDDVGGFQVEVAQDANPAAHIAYRITGMPAGKTWRFHHWTYSSTAYLDNYQEFSLARTTWAYDESGHGSSVGRLTSVLYPAGTGSESHTYNWAGKETSTTRCVGTTCQTFGQTYDTLQRLQTITYPDSEVVGYGYAADGNLNTVSSSSGLPYVTGMTWSPAGQLKAMIYGNGTRTDYTYDPNRLWLSSAAVGLNYSGSLYTAVYTYNAAALVTSMSQGTPTASTLNFIYDDLNRLTNVSAPQLQNLAYDPIGNMTSNSTFGGTYTYGPTVSGCTTTQIAKPHAVLSANGSTYTYDCNGNLLSGGGRTYTWNIDNLPASITQGGSTVTFAYDASGQRIQKTQGANSTLYFGLSEQVNGAMLQYYYAGPILVAKKQAGAQTWYHSDRLGSIRLMTNAAGAEVKDYDYQAFGNTQSQSGTEYNERGFNGHISDAETGLIYMGARYYDAQLGRFLSADTIVASLANPQDLNRYSYVNNNPINNTDPTGHMRCVTCAGDGDMSPQPKPRSANNTGNINGNDHGGSSPAAEVKHAEHRGGGFWAPSSPESIFNYKVDTQLSHYGPYVASPDYPGMDPIFKSAYGETIYAGCGSSTYCTTAHVYHLSGSQSSWLESKIVHSNDQTDGEFLAYQELDIVVDELTFGTFSNARAAAGVAAGKESMSFYDTLKANNQHDTDAGSVIQPVMVVTVGPTFREVNGEFEDYGRMAVYLAKDSGQKTPPLFVSYGFGEYLDRAILETVVAERR